MLGSTLTETLTSHRFTKKGSVKKIIIFIHDNNKKLSFVCMCKICSLKVVKHIMPHRGMMLHDRGTRYSMGRTESGVNERIFNAVGRLASWRAFQRDKITKHFRNIGNIGSQYFKYNVYWILYPLITPHAGDIHFYPQAAGVHGRPWSSMRRAQRVPAQQWQGESDRYWFYGCLLLMLTVAADVGCSQKSTCPKHPLQVDFELRWTPCECCGGPHCCMCLGYIPKII